MSAARRVARRAAYLFLAAGLLALGYAGFVTISARAYQAAEHERFERERRDAVAAFGRARAPAAIPAPLDGASVGEVDIPRIGLTAVVVHGESTAILQRAVAHLPGTAMPGATGNVVLAGHRDTFFRPLRNVRVGDTIALRTRAGNFTYRVEWTSVVPPSAVDVLLPTGGHTLTLVTCFPFGYVGAAPDRFIVRARETSSLR